MNTKEITSRLNKISFNLNLIRQFFESLKQNKPVSDKILNNLWLDLYHYYTEIVLPHVLRKEDWETIFDTGEGNDEEMKEKIKEMREEGYSDEEILEYMDEQLYSSAIPAYNYSSEEATKVINELKNAKTDNEKIVAINIALHQYHDNGNILRFMNREEFEQYDEFIEYDKYRKNNK